MGGLKLDLTPGAALALGLAVFLGDGRALAALGLAVAAHETGHLLMLRLCGKRLRRVSLTLFGPEIDYRGALLGREALLCIGGGPLLGLLYAAAALSLPGALWQLSGALSLLLSLFNLLPVLPLDGGRLLSALRGEDTARRVSRVLSPALLLAGVWALRRYQAPGLLLTGAWLTLRTALDSDLSRG